MKLQVSKKTNLFVPAMGFLMITLVLSTSPCRGEVSPRDREYIEKFEKKFPPNSPVRTLEDYATPDRYDDLYMGPRLEASLENVTNDGGGIAWGLSYRMISLNQMYRATGDPRYLEANLKCIRAVIAARDDKNNKKLWTGETTPAWSCVKYAERGRAVFAVHTGIIVYPMLDFLFLAGKFPRKMPLEPSVFAEILRSATEALYWHDRQWKEGPEPNEGHYIGLNQENILEGKPLPGNRLSAMGRALWLSWKVTGSRRDYHRALNLARYIKKRLTRAPDGAYYWEYWLPENPVTAGASRESLSGEDTSHAGLTAGFPLLLAVEGEVFDKEDLKRLGNTVVHGFGRLGGGILFGDITGNPGSSPDFVWGAARWLVTAREVPEVEKRILPFYLKYVKTPNPLALAYLVCYRNGTLVGQ